MKLVSYLKDEQDQLALLVDGMLYDMEYIHPDLPNTMSMLLNYWEACYPMLMAGRSRSGKKKYPEKKASRSIRLKFLLLSLFPVPAGMHMPFGNM